VNGSIRGLDFPSQSDLDSPLRSEVHAKTMEFRGLAHTLPAAGTGGDGNAGDASLGRSTELSSFRCIKRNTLRKEDGTSRHSRAPSGLRTLNEAFAAQAAT
jgi:hypothetical protein